MMRHGTNWFNATRGDLEVAARESYDADVRRYEERPEMPYERYGEYLDRKRREQEDEDEQR